MEIISFVLAILFSAILLGGVFASDRFAGHGTFFRIAAYVLVFPFALLITAESMEVEKSIPLWGMVILACIPPYSFVYFMRGTLCENADAPSVFMEVRNFLNNRKTQAIEKLLEEEATEQKSRKACRAAADRKHTSARAERKLEKAQMFLPKQQRLV